MKRTTLAVLVVAALVGTAGGTVTAVVRDRAASAGPPGPTAGPTRTPSPSPPRTPSATPSPSPAPEPDPLLYVADGVIHDGAEKIRYRGATDHPWRLLRTHNGYLIAYNLDRDDPDGGSRLSAVDPDGTTRTVGEISGYAFDLDEDRRRVVGPDRADRLTVWDLRGRVQAKARKEAVSLLDPVFTGDTVLFSGRVGKQGSGSWPLWQWDPRTGAVDAIDDELRSGMMNLVGSPGKDLVAGDVGVAGSPDDEGDEGSACTQVFSAPGAGTVSWRTCDWRRFASPRSFSPDGRRLLVIAAGTPYGGEADYSGATFAVFSATQGPSDGLTRVTAPDGTTSAYWGGDDRLIFQTTTFDADEVANGYALRECRLDGRCREIARREGLATEGEQY